MTKTDASILFAGQLTESDIHRAVALFSSEQRRWLWYGVLLLTFGYSVWQVFNAETFIALGIVTVVMYIGVFWSQPLLQRCLDLFRTDKRLQIALEGQATVHGISTKGKGYTQFTPWSAFLYFRCVDDMVALIRAGGAISPYPRSLFQSESDWNHFRMQVKISVAELPKRHTYTIQPTKEKES